VELRLGDVLRLEVLLADSQGIERPGALDAAIADAQEEIDAALASRYSFPLTGTVPAQVARWTADMALATLAESRPGGLGGGLAKKADRARGEIEAVRKGMLSIPGLAARDLVAGGTDEAPKKLTDGPAADGAAGTMDKW